MRLADVTIIANTTATNTGTTIVSTSTSFTTPLTAGVAALMLSINPNASREEVVPRDVSPGESYEFDVEQRDGFGVTVGGVRLMIVVN